MLDKQENALLTRSPVCCAFLMVAGGVNQGGNTSEWLSDVPWTVDATWAGYTFIPRFLIVIDSTHAC